jgi:hypothetical protein
VKQTGWNAEHNCVGGNGTTSGSGYGGWGNQRDGIYDSNWCMSARVRNAAILLLIRQPAPPPGPGSRSPLRRNAARAIDRNPQFGCPGVVVQCRP